MNERILVVDDEKAIADLVGIYLTKEGFDVQIAYGGADAAFELYRDDGRTYAYERGEYTLTRLNWNDAAGEMTVQDDRDGLFTGPREKWLRRMG